MSAKYTIQDIQEFASGLNGRCLSKEYIDDQTPLDWACKKGHRWDLSFSKIKLGAWCPMCQKNEQYLEPIREIVEAKGGELLTTEYQSCETKLVALCEKGHKFERTPPQFKKGIWCNWCDIEKKRLDATRILQKIVNEKEGKLISSYEFYNQELVLVCKNGHRFKQKLKQLKNGVWCKKCYVESSRMDISILQKKAEERGGKLITTKYTSSTIPMVWECEYGHQWEDKGARILYHDAWCKVCTRNKKLARQEKVLDKMRKMAKEQGGRCLSTEFGSHDTRIEFECARKHRWYANKQDFLHGSWCRICADKYNAKKKKLDIEQFRKKAIENGGKLISNKYRGLQYLLEWECKKGHRWKASPANVYHNNSWCKICAYEAMAKKRVTPIEVFQKIAIKRGGKCLSKEYVLGKKLKFICAHNHEWETMAINIKAKCWCPECGRLKRRKKK